MDDRASLSLSSTLSHFPFPSNVATPHAATLAREERRDERGRKGERARASRRRETVHKAAKYGKGGKGCICPARGCCLSPVVILQSAVSTLSELSYMTTLCNLYMFYNISLSRSTISLPFFYFTHIFSPLFHSSMCVLILFGQDFEIT